jgi:DNA-directed RNA polymerase specialized sigma24 family protein
MTGPDDSGPASVPPSGARVDDEDAPPSSGTVSARDAGEDAPPSSGTTTRVTGAIFSFIASRKDGEGRDFVIRVVKRRLGEDIPRAMLEDIVQASLTEAAECRWPPWLASKVPAWLGRLTRRQIAAYFRKDKGRQDRPKPGQPDRPEPTARPRDARSRNAEAARLDARDDGAEGGPRVDPKESTEWIGDHHAPPTDERARARLIHDWLAKQISDSPAKVRTLELMKEHHVDGFTLAELAAREKTTERALANRFHKLRAELAPKVRRMDDEKTRRSVIFGLLFFLFAGVVALVVWLLLALAPPPLPPVLPVHDVTPPASASAPAPPPVFNQALPTPSESAVPEPPLKPNVPK